MTNIKQQYQSKNNIQGDNNEDILTFNKFC